MKPIVFIASSVRNEALVAAVARQLSDIATPRIWMDGQTVIAVHILDWVVAEVNQSEFGVFIFAPDERWGNQVNGNVLLEVGIAVSRLGRERCLIMTAQGLELPSDLKGIVTAEYDPAAFASQGDSAIAPACAAIAKAITGRRSLAQVARGLWLEVKDASKSEGGLSLIEIYVQRGDLKVRGRSYDSRGEETLEWPDTVNYCHVMEERRELWHTFDSRFGRAERDIAIGVTCFRFDGNGRTGRGHFIVSGEGGIQEGLITFTLRRITPDFLAGATLSNAELALDDKEYCHRLIQEYLATAP